jgi:4-pyridoxolactonase
MLGDLAPTGTAPMKVTILPAGTMLIDHSQLFWNHEPGRSIRHPVYAVLVEHPAGNVLIDTGFDLAHVSSVLPFVEPEAEPGGVDAGLERAGVALGAVDYLVHTHLHFDHVGRDAALRGTTVFVHREELRQARTPEPFEHLSYSDRQFENPHVKLEVLEGDVELLPGIVLLETPGHSAGHYSVLLRGESGRQLLFCGDASYTAQNLERTVISGFHLDPVASVRSLGRLRRLADRTSAALFFPHDPDSFATYRVSPDSYEI